MLDAEKAIRETIGRAIPGPYREALYNGGAYYITDAPLSKPDGRAIAEIFGAFYGKNGRVTPGNQARYFVACCNGAPEILAELDRLRAESAAQLRELDAIADALGTRDGHSSVPHIERLREENEALRLSLRTIAEFPLTDPQNMDAANMRDIARAALAHRSQEAG